MAWEPAAASAFPPFLPPDHRNLPTFRRRLRGAPIAMSQRLQKVNELLRREISSAIARDLEFPGALVTINSVEVTPDLRQGTVYIGLIGDPHACRDALELIDKKRGHIQGKVASRVVLRYFPKLTFKADDSVERGTDILHLLEEVDRLPTAPPAEDENEEHGGTPEISTN